MALAVGPAMRDDARHAAEEIRIDRSLAVE